MSKIGVEDLIESLIATEKLWIANYYLSSMKKAPHGGIFSVKIPNYYIHHNKKKLFNIFRCNDIDRVVDFLEVILKDVIIELEKYDFDINEIANMIFLDPSNWYISFIMLKPKEDYEESNKDIPLIWRVIDKGLKIEDYFLLDKQIVEYLFVCWIIDNNFIKIKDLFEIKKFEKLLNNHDKYGLIQIDGGDFQRQGFTYKDKYYLYNILLDTSIIGAHDNVPGTIKIILEEIENVSFKMRVDENLSIEKSKLITTHSTDSQVFRGIKFDIEDIEKLVDSKKIIVHFNPVTLEKLVMIIKPDKEDNERFYHIEIEELWNCDSIEDNVVLTNFIHSKYYPKSKKFKHIDFSVNQYDIKTYKHKYRDNCNATGIPIDIYCDTHYKVWCAEAEKIEIKTWSKLVVITLDEPFRDLFFEIVGEDIQH